MSKETEDIQATVLTGMKIMYSAQMLPMLKQGLEAEAPWPPKLASQVAGLMKMIDDKTPSGIPAKAVAPAAQMLLADMIQFIAYVGGPKLSRNVVNQTLPMLKKVLIEVFTKHGKGAKAQQGQAPQPAQQQAQPQQPPAQPGLLGAQ